MARLDPKFRQAIKQTLLEKYPDAKISMRLVYEDLIHLKVTSKQFRGRKHNKFQQIMEVLDTLDVHASSEYADKYLFKVEPIAY